MYGVPHRILQSLKMDNSSQWASYLESESSSDSDSDGNLLLLMLDESDGGDPDEIRNRLSRMPNKDRKRELYDRLLFHDYWGPNPSYTKLDFRNSFRIPIELFDEFVIRVQQYDPYFIRKSDACKNKGLSAKRKSLVLCESLPADHPLNKKTIISEWGNLPFWNP